MGSGVFFFFQAEDGIRDGRVTGVQTCALPICADLAGARRSRRLTVAALPEGVERLVLAEAAEDVRRSEERRVGKECRLWGTRPPSTRNNHNEIDPVHLRDTLDVAFSAVLNLLL